MSRRKYYIERIAAVIAALILLQTLFYKFSGHEDSVYIFSILGIEPYGRIGLGILELISAFLLLYPKTAIYGSLMSIGMMLGAIGSHLFVLGIAVKDDGGSLFGLAIVVFLCSFIVLFIRKHQLYSFFRRKLRKEN